LTPTKVSLRLTLSREMSDSSSFTLQTMEKSARKKLGEWGWMLWSANLWSALSRWKKHPLFRG
jgi:hypothetical protein